MRGKLNGKWSGNDAYGRMDIDFVDGDKQKLLISFHTFGFFFIEPVEWNISGNILNISVNDEANRGIYKLTLLDGETLTGTYSQYGKESPILLKKISDTPEDREFYRGEPTVQESDDPVPKSNLSRLELLLKFKGYSEPKEKIPYTYNLNEKEKYMDFIAENKLDEITAGKEDCDLMFALLGWVCDNVKHNGGMNFPKERNAYELLRHARENNNTLNCRGLSLLLAELLRAYGIKAAHVTCFPYELPFEECHVVVHAWSEKLNKWIMMDPTYRMYLMNKDGEIINLPEFREILMEYGEFSCNSDANYQESAPDLTYYRNYMTKNMFRFERTVNLYYGVEPRKSGDSFKNLIPVKYAGIAGKFSEEDKNSFVTSDADFWSL